MPCRTAKNYYHNRSRAGRPFPTSPSAIPSPNNIAFRRPNYTSPFLIQMDQEWALFFDLDGERRTRRNTSHTREDIMLRRIKFLRLGRGLTQWELSHRAGMSQGRYSLIERGLIEPTTAERDGFAKILGASPGTLMHSAVRERKADSEITGEIEM